MTKIKDYIRGDTRYIQLNCTLADGTTPIDLTGATVKFTVNSSNNPADDTSAAFQKTLTSFVAQAAGVTNSGVAFAKGADTTVLGVAWPVVQTTDTATLTPADYYYDAQVRDATGNVYSLKKDVFTINSDITRT